MFTFTNNFRVESIEEQELPQKVKEQLEEEERQAEKRLIERQKSNFLIYVVHQLHTVKGKIERHDKMSLEQVASHESKDQSAQKLLESYWFFTSDWSSQDSDYKPILERSKLRRVDIEDWSKEDECDGDGNFVELRL